MLRKSSYLGGGLVMAAILAACTGSDSTGPTDGPNALAAYQTPPPCFGQPATIYPGMPNQAAHFFPGAGPGGSTLIVATSGDDVIVGTDGDDYIHGGDGDDRICGGTGNDRLFGDFGNDRLNGNHGDDLLEGGYGDDLVEGADGNDFVQGNYGNDRVEGNRGRDIVSGGFGTDYVWGGPDGDDCRDPDGTPNTTFVDCESTTFIAP
jgi:Ca2+-binding RTX toxin-like protein